MPSLPVDLSGSRWRPIWGRYQQRKKIPVNLGSNRTDEKAQKVQSQIDGEGGPSEVILGKPECDVTPEESSFVHKQVNCL